MTFNFERAIVARSLRLLTCALAVAGLAITFLAFAARHDAVAASDAFDAGQRAQIEAIIKDYLLKNPELLMQMDEALKQKTEADNAVKFKAAIADSKDAVFHNPALPFAGDPKGDVTAVEFFDYNCPHCRNTFEGVSKLLDSDKKVHFVFIDVPIIAPQLKASTAIALAAMKQGKYWEVHKAFMEAKGTINEERAYLIAGKLGLDMAKLKTDAESDAVKKLMDDNLNLANKLNVSGTPFFMVGDHTVSGEASYEEFASMVADTRKNGCKIC